jgi:hypothetical protein
MIFFMAPTEPPPRPVRPELRIFMATLKPWPTSPSTLALGTRTPSNATVVVLLARRPILSSWGPMLMPAMSLVTRNAVMPPLRPSSVLANTVKKLAMPPLVIHSLLPLSTHSSPSRWALVVMEAASEPAPGSVRQKAAIISPVASFG